MVNITFKSREQLLGPEWHPTSLMFTWGDLKITIFHSVDCQSPWVIYIIECRLQCIGKSETGFNLHLNNHRNHIKKEVNSCKLTEHFLHNVRSHNFENDITITVIEQIRKDHLTIDRKKELLCN